MDNNNNNNQHSPNKIENPVETGFEEDANCNFDDEDIQEAFLDRCSDILWNFIGLKSPVPEQKQ